MMSDRKGGNKRKKGYYLASKKKPRLQHSLQPGLKGFLITCNKREREAVTEGYKLLGEYAEKLYGPEKDGTEQAHSSDDDNDDDDDLEAALQKEVAALKSSKKTERRFQQVECGANNCVFIKTTVPDPTRLLHAIFEDLLETGCSKSRHIMRILPVISTCRASDEFIEKAVPEALQPFFAQDDAPSHCLQFKIRNNNSVSRTALLPLFGRLISDLCPKSKVNFDAPDLVVSVDVIKTICCISAMRDFHKFRKYNLQEVATLAQRRLAGEEKQGPESGDQPVNSKKLEEESEKPETDLQAETTSTVREEKQVSETGDQSEDSKTLKEESEKSETVSEAKRASPKSQSEEITTDNLKDSAADTSLDGQTLKAASHVT